MLARKHPEIRKGGWYVPSNFTKLHKVAIIVPYRDRKKHLSIFLYYMHMFLMKQRMEYGIFIIEQAGTRPFNRGMLMNVGFLESQKMGTWECFIFHDVDLLPLDQRNLYQCAKQPRHLSASIDSMAYKLPYGHIFGGATAMTLEQFTKANGFSNRYWGWGGEDDDMYRRLWMMGYRVKRYDMSIARYTMLSHSEAEPNPKRRPILENATKVFKEEGLSTLHYEVIELTWHQLYTHIIAKLDEKTTVDIRSNVANMTVGGKM
ncbi:beta-1,4-N-acetylgalactosaminyltransferase bre-4-like [Leguminivora glycinivorella]|uniref:beta-1,4-N-acetylgalactosaminyltransferase bre-4-like n=1 Tax=Leguminivora glycinivorella TaxID=1035111 RepID=UPI00200FAACF|nr:beta-1,4-N-acetylgalactosaminyltransferase bre-4-like [Leguminivora glycinivorella]